jgi:hypothetical protein
VRSLSLDILKTCGNIQYPSCNKLSWAVVGVGLAKARAQLDLDEASL